MIREDWYTSKGDKMQYVIYTFDAEHRSEKREVFEEKETWEGKFDVLKEMSIYYYNAEGKVICIEEYNPESQRVEFTYTYVYQTVQVPVDFFAPLYVNPTERKVIFQGDDSQPAEPVDAVFNTKNIVRITFYAYYGGGKGSDVSAENMAEIINWLNSFTVGEKAPDILPPGTGTRQVEIEYADGTVIKRSLDTITIDGVIYYLDSDPWPEILAPV